MSFLAPAAPGAVFLLNAPYGPDEVWQHLPRKTQETILARKLLRTSPARQPRAVPACRDHARWIAR